MTKECRVQDFEKASRLWTAGAGRDDKTRIALERASMKYFYEAMGIERGPRADQTRAPAGASRRADVAGETHSRRLE